MRLLVDYYKTGDLKLFDAYSIEWLKDTESSIDFINGFIEVYGDALAYKASWESVVEIVDEEACRRTRKLAEHALWFEQHAPVADCFKKAEVKGITARVMQVAMLGGDCHPATPIGILMLMTRQQPLLACWTSLPGMRKRFVWRGNAGHWGATSIRICMNVWGMVREKCCPV